MSISLPTQYKVKINIPYGKLQPIVDWCERNCTDDYRFMEGSDNYVHTSSWIFFFEAERDYVAFKIWKT